MKKMLKIISLVVLAIIVIIVSFILISTWSTKRKINLQVSRMSIEEKVGQMIIIGVSGTKPDYYVTKMINERNIGGVCFLGSNITDAKQVTAFTSDLQALSKNNSQKIPLFIAIDQEGGIVSRIKFDNADLTAQKDINSISLAYKVAKERGNMLKSLGINMNFAPVLDYSLGKGFMKDRAFNTTIENHILLGKKMIQGYTNAKIIAVPKHYLGHGSQESDSHDTFVKISSDELESQKKIWKKILPISKMIMIGHMSSEQTSNRPYSLSDYTYKELKDSFKYTGLTITDDINMGAITKDQTVEDASIKAVKAGVDIILTLNMPEDQVEIYDSIVSAIKSGEIQISQVDNSVKKILYLKYKYLGYKPELLY
ncbi:hypothetical protein M0R04_02715 [Candidatus Dojkabacteria bacterium]|jgi:beta-N-acetylhexosaminidase|nr:hypothetical protein [Candidatus Dojkabacteria bacterium]